MGLGLVLGKELQLHVMQKKEIPGSISWYLTIVHPAVTKKNSEVSRTAVAFLFHFIETLGAGKCLRALSIVNF